jgi:hypothetical protein
MAACQVITVQPCGESICVVKFYDKTTDGIQNFGEVGIVWKFTITGGPNNVTLTGFTDTNGNLCFMNLAPGTYTVTEANATPKSVAVATGGTAKFGNVCLGAGGADGTPGFWRNKNGENIINDAPNGAVPELLMLSNLCLRAANGTDFNPKNYPDLNNWMKGANSVNAAYQLSVHLACMALNVESGRQSGTAMVYAPGAPGANAQGYITINALMTAANTLLCQDGSIPSNDPQRAYALLLLNALNTGNNNTGYVQPTPCPASFSP